MPLSGYSQAYLRRTVEFLKRILTKVNVDCPPPVTSVSILL